MTSHSQQFIGTPKLWRFKQHEMDCEIFSDEWGPIAVTKGGHATKMERLANAKLIAAAPELLEACIAMQMEAAARGCGLKIADDAIAKATKGAP